MEMRDGVVVGGLASVVSVLVGCGNSPIFPILVIDASDDQYEQVVEVPATPNRDLDLLFVIDDSPSMLDKQTNLANNFPNFISQLSALPGGLPNLHLGVITTDMGTLSTSGVIAPSIGSGQGSCSNSGGKNGVLQLGQAGTAVQGNFISDVLDANGTTRLTNYTGTLATVFGQMARVGATGCGFEQHLHAVRAAFDNNVANQGFLRPSALLAIVFVTDEDDCSMKNSGTLLAPESAALGPLQSFRCTRFGVRCGVGGTTSDEMNQVGVKSQCGSNPASPELDDVAVFRDFLVGLKATPASIVVGGIMGNPSPVAVELRTPPGGGASQSALTHSCTYTGANGLEVADPAVRLQALLDMFPGRSAFSTVCQQDLSGPLQTIGQLVAASIGSSCVTAALPDADPGMAGDQYDCRVEDVVGSTVTPVMPCDVNLTPTCWVFEPDAQTCPSAAHLKLVVHRGATTPAPGTVTRLKCVVL